MTPAEIRITFDPGNSWSTVGRDALLVPAGSPTINFGWFADVVTDKLVSRVTDQEIRRTVLHEFGHALGFIHEHQSPAAGILMVAVASITKSSTSAPTAWPGKTALFP